MQIKRGRFLQLTKKADRMNSLPQILHTISYMGLPLLFAMVLHEYAHGWVAYRCGDQTAKLQGRLTMNPLAHIDPFGTVILPLLCLVMPGGFFLGWAKPVPIDPAHAQPRRDMDFRGGDRPWISYGYRSSSSALLCRSIPNWESVQIRVPLPDTWHTMFLLRSP